jgi:hypothetical protein
MWTRFVQMQVVVLISAGVFSVYASATPIISVHKDVVRLRTLIEVSPTSGGTIRHKDAYLGSLLDGSAAISSDPIDVDILPIDEQTHLEALAHVQRYASSGWDLDAKTYGLDDFYDESNGIPVHSASVYASASFRMTFDVLDEDTSLQMISAVYAGDAYMSLFDLTTNSLVDSVGNPALCCQDHRELTLLEGHQYELQGNAVDYNFSDENPELDFSFDAQVVKAPEPAPWGLTIIGLCCLAWLTRRTSARRH